MKPKLYWINLAVWHTRREIGIWMTDLLLHASQRHTFAKLPVATQIHQESFHVGIGTWFRTWEMFQIWIV